MKRTMAVWSVLVCMVLSACGGAAAEPDAPLAQAAGVDAEAVFLTVDGREIPAWQYLHWLAADCAQLEQRYAQAGEPLDWTAPGSDGETPEERVKYAALADTALCVAVETWAEAYGCTLTAEEWDDLPEWTEPYLTQEQCRYLAALGRQYVKLYRLYQTAGSPLAPAEGELALFERETGMLAAERLLIPMNGDRETARQLAGTLFARINGAEDSDAAFTALLPEYGGEMTAADWSGVLLDAASAMEPGQMSGILETETGFCILRRLETDQSALREAHFDSLLLAAAADSELLISDACDALSPASFWAALQTVEGK